MYCENCEKAREFEKVIERVHELLESTLPKVNDPDVRQKIEEALKQTKILYHRYEVPPDASPDEVLETAIQAAINRAVEKAKEDKEPCVVAETPSGQILITRRSRFEREKPFGTGPESLIYDTETGRRKNA
jgi:citrate lyase gamma subunit